MIVGVVNARREPVVGLRLRGPAGIEAAVEAVVDTGFSGYLTLPADRIAALGLQRHSVSGAVLADGTVPQFAIHAAEVRWEGAWRAVLVSGVGAEVLAGMRVLADQELRVEAVPGGRVSITPLP